MGRLGVFEAKVLGGMRHIGMPSRQSLLSPQDELALKSQFAVCGLEPHRNLSAAAARSLASRARLRPRPAQVLSLFPQTDVSCELLDDIIDVYESWDGENPAASHQSKTKLPIRIRFQAKDLRLESIAALCTLPDGIDFQPCAEHAHITIQNAESRDGSRELLLSDGQSIAETMDWFDGFEIDFIASDGREFTCYRRQASQRYFVKQGSAWIEILQEEFETNRRYLEIKKERSSGLLGSSTALASSEAWKQLTHPLGILFRLIDAPPDVSTTRYTRSSAIQRGGIRSQSRAGNYFDFALPDLAWPHTDPQDPIVVLRFHWEDAEPQEMQVEPRSSSLSAGDLLPATDRSSVLVELPLQPLVDPYISASRTPAAIQAFLKNNESGSSAWIFLQRSDPPIRASAPPRRNQIGALAVDGVLAGPVGTQQALPCVDLNAIQFGPPMRVGAAEPCLTSPHYRLCRLLRSRTALEWSQARDQIRQCGRDNSFDDRFSLTGQLFALHQLAVLEIIESDDAGLDRVQALTPRLAVTVAQANLGIRPGAGIARARRFLLSGAWLPEELKSLLSAVRRYPTLQYSEIPIASDTTLLPPYRCVLAPSETAVRQLGEICTQLNIEHESAIPDAVSSLGSCSSISDAVDRLDWREGSPDAGFDVFEFDPEAICRIRRSNGQHSLRLRECRRRDSGTWKYFLVDESRPDRPKHAEIHDRQLGRWITRARILNEAPLPVDAHGALLVPLELRLPRHLERVLALESGRGSETVWFSSSGSPFSSPFRDPEVAKRFGIPAPTTDRIRPYAVDGHFSHTFLRYPNVFGTAIWPSGTAMPILNLCAERISTLGLTGDNQ